MARNGAVLGLKTADGRRPRVALVGGTPAGAMVAGVLIEHFGCAPITLKTGNDVLSLIARREPVDLIVIDMVADDTDGFVTAQLLRSLGARRAPPVVALTGDREAMPQQMRAAGFAGTVFKPYSPRELYGVMHVALRGTAELMASPA